MRVALGTIDSAQMKDTEATSASMVQLLSYCATHLYADIFYYESDIIMHISSDESYLSTAEARSCTGGFFYLGQQNGKMQLINGPLICLLNMPKIAMSSAAESELVSIFLDSKEAAHLLVMLALTLTERGRPHPATPTHIENSTAYETLNNKVNRKW
jgi:hypothetical protein